MNCWGLGQYSGRSIAMNCCGLGRCSGRSHAMCNRSGLNTLCKNKHVSTSIVGFNTYQLLHTCRTSGLLLCHTLALQQLQLHH